MLSLDEAIKQAEEKMLENLEKTKDRNAADPVAINCFEHADKYRQLVEWLTDYKRLSKAVNDIKTEIDRYLTDEGFGTAYRQEVFNIIDRHIGKSEDKNEYI